MTDHGARHQHSLGGLTERLLRERRDLNEGFGNALGNAFELALTPAIFAFIGWRLDVWLGTGPLFLVVLFLLVVGYQTYKLFRSYDERMEVEEQRLRGDRGPQ